MKNKALLVPALMAVAFATSVALSYDAVVVYQAKEMKVTLNGCTFTEKTATLGGTSVEMVCGPTNKENVEFAVTVTGQYFPMSDQYANVDFNNCYLDAAKGLVCPGVTFNSYQLRFGGFMYVDYENGQFTCTDKFGNNAVTAPTFQECVLKYLTQGQDVPVTVSVAKDGFSFTVNAEYEQAVVEFGYGQGQLVRYNTYTNKAVAFAALEPQGNVVYLTEGLTSTLAEKVHTYMADVAQTLKALPVTTQPTTTTTTPTQPTTTQPTTQPTTVEQPTAPQEAAQPTQPTTTEQQVTAPTQTQPTETQQTAEQATQTQPTTQEQVTQPTTENKTNVTQPATQQQAQGGSPVIYLVAAAVVIAAVAGAVYFLKQKQGTA